MALPINAEAGGTVRFAARRFALTAIVALRALGRWWFFTRLPAVSVSRIVSAMRLRFASTSSTFTFTICPALTTLCESLKKVWDSE